MILTTLFAFVFQFEFGKSSYVTELLETDACDFTGDVLLCVVLSVATPSGNSFKILQFIGSDALFLTINLPTPFTSLWNLVMVSTALLVFVFVSCMCCIFTGLADCICVMKPGSN